VRISTAVLTTAAVVAAGGVGIASPATAHADLAADPGSHQLGSQAVLTNGNVEQGWTVSNLQPSSDTIPYAVQGTLWEATASDEAIQGSVIPIVSNLNARAAGGQTYRDLYQVATAQGVNPATLAQGQKTTGKIYFDVTAAPPTSVVYSDGNATLATWTLPAAGQGAPGTAPRGQSVPGPAAGVPPKPGSTPAAPAGSQGTPLPTGSQGTPLPAGASATPTTTPTTPPPAPAGNGSQESTPTPPASPAPSTTPVPAGNGSVGTPAGSQTGPTPTNTAGTPPS
jgi:hypothetical protein